VTAVIRGYVTVNFIICNQRLYEGMLLSSLPFRSASDGVAGQLHHQLLLSVLTDNATVTWLCSASLESG